MSLLYNDFLCPMCKTTLKLDKKTIEKHPFLQHFSIQTLFITIKWQCHIEIIILYYMIKVAVYPTN